MLKDVKKQLENVKEAWHIQTMTVIEQQLTIVTADKEQISSLKYFLREVGLSDTSQSQKLSLAM